MDNEFFNLLEEMANIPGFPCDYHNSEHAFDSAIITANQKAEQLTDYVMNTPFEKNTEMPGYLKSQIINRVHQPDVQQIVNTPTQRHPISKQLELFFYSCKVAGAVAAAFIMMLTTSATGEWRKDNNSKLSDIRISVQNTETDNPANFDGAASTSNGTEKKGIHITEHLNKGSSLFTCWLQNISDRMVNGNGEQ